MPAFHLMWIAFFFCFVAWLACISLKPAIQDGPAFAVEQAMNSNTAVVAVRPAPAYQKKMQLR